MAKPETSITLKTYEELEGYVRAFSEEYLNLLVVVGSAGLQKTRLIRDTLGHAGTCWIEGNATPFGIYCELWRHRDEPVVFDDLDSVYHDKAAVRLLKCLCQTERLKTVAWHSDAKTLERESIPRSFRTRSPVAIIANEWRTVNANVQAIEDRGHVVFFQPTPLEVHKRTAEWFWDQQVFDFISQHLHLVTRPSMRHYVLASEKKQAGLDWRAAFLQQVVSGAGLAVAKLLADPSYSVEEDRVRAFIAKTGCSRATYFRHKAELYGQVAPPRITLKRNTPQADFAAKSQNLISFLRGRYDNWGTG